MDAAGSLLPIRNGRVDLNRRIVQRGDERTELSTMACKLLRFFVAHPSTDLDHEQLYRGVWGHTGRMPVSWQGAKTTVSRLRRAIEADPSTPELILTVQGVGYRFEPLAGAAGGDAVADLIPGSAYQGASYGARPRLEAEAARRLAQPSAPLLVIGPHRIGKTWFLEHLLATHATDADRIVRVPVVEDPERWEGVAASMITQLGLRPADVLAELNTAGPPQERLATVLHDVLLPATPARLLLVLDALERWPEDGRLANDWIRAWSAQRQAPWDRLRILAATSTEPVVAIDAPDLSSMRLVPPLYLDDLSPTVVSQLAERAHVPIDEVQLQALRGEIGGHPFLVHLFFDELRHADADADALLARCAEPMGVFASWLRRPLRKLQQDPEALQAVHRVMDAPDEPLDPLLANRLERAGLLRLEGAGYRIRYGVLERFLRMHR
ncbi:MAG: AAA-like domain-containing protein [Myxococcales bacterium]|nr:AAA-like domain-containing protein [Myxococcales bacterium]